MTQILLVLASSQIQWTPFHLVGYSFGGAVSVSFARYFPHRLASLNLIAGGGLIRPYHVSWKSNLLYNSGLLPEWLVRILVKRRIRPAAEAPQSAGGLDIAAAESKLSIRGDGDATGGAAFDSASISKHRPDVSVSSVVAWQIDHHPGFITAFLSSIRNSPIYAPQEDWKFLAANLSARRRTAVGGDTLPSGLAQGKVMLVLGADDSVIVARETIEDVQEVLGMDAVEYTVLPAGHELPITLSSEVADSMEQFWAQSR